MKISSPVFIDGELLPAKYTCDGAGISPPIQWQDLPANTKSLALIYDDPDAPYGTWVHWVLYNLPPTVSALDEGITTLPSGTQVGLNSWPHAKYGAPCPPSGEHRYIFHLYALDVVLNLSAPVTSKKLRQEMRPHLLATATLMGCYRRAATKNPDL